MGDVIRLNFLIMHGLHLVGKKDGIKKHKAFWELTGFGSHQNPEVKRVHARAILGWVTHWEVLV
ncbi:hypothetical protein DVH24_034187 [Malus domestica]|uniref:Uncharacterized protein n=1 Tax=Malus domestica TaxID=3750 RepID=A0A498I6W0_MALDO|nr:hypothetical protein DVH24_034187 [Malus domestica]